MAQLLKISPVVFLRICPGVMFKALERYGENNGVVPTKTMELASYDIDDLQGDNGGILEFDRTAELTDI